MIQTFDIVYHTKGNGYFINTGSGFPSSFGSDWILAGDAQGIRVNPFGFKFDGNNTVIITAEEPLIRVELLNFEPTNFTIQVYREYASVNSPDMNAWVNSNDYMLFYRITVGIDEDSFKCLDAYGTEIDEFVYGDDGIIYGIPNKERPDTKTNISRECCTSLGFEFDGVSCHWSNPESCDEDVKIIFNSNGNNGSFFQIDDSDNCQLNVKFDYLFNFDCKELANCFRNEKDNESPKLDYSTLISEINSKLEINSIKINSLNDIRTKTLTKIDSEISKYLNEIEGISIRLGEINSIRSINFETADKEAYKKYLVSKKITENERNQLIKSTNELRYEIEKLTDKRVALETSTNNKVAALSAENIELTTKLSRYEAEVSTLAISELSTNPTALLNSLGNFKVRVELMRVNGAGFETVYIEDLYNVTDITQYLINTENTGFLFNSDEKQCRYIKNQINEDLGVILPENRFNSPWLTYNKVINDPTLLSIIANRELKIALIISNFECEFTILMDNIELNRVCKKTEIKKETISESPSFNLVKTIDNKKSWVAKDELEQRIFDLTNRYTNYHLNHHKLAVNSKELELNTAASNAIEYDVFTFIKEYVCLLDDLIGDNEVLNQFFKDLAFCNDLVEFRELVNTTLIDAKSRKTISAYPLLNIIYNRYIRSDEYCGVLSNRYDFNLISRFLDVFGNHWIELIEQMVPATTLWGSSNKYSNTMFYDNKFVYKKSSLFYCDTSMSDVIAQDEEVEVVISQLTNISDSASKAYSCSNVFIRNIDDGSEFIGSYKVLTRNMTNSSEENNINGQTKVINESLRVIVPDGK